MPFSKRGSKLSRLGREDGQILVIAAALFTVVIGFSAMAIDVGFWLHTRTKLQADADAMALAGAQKLCAAESCDADAVSLAKSYAGPNDLANAEIVSVKVGIACDGSTSSNHDIITVKTRRNVPTFLARLLGVTDADVTSCATAQKGELGGANGVVPFGIEDDCLGAGEFGAGYTLKFDSDPQAGSGITCDKYGGNYGALAIDTSGAGSGCSGGPSGDELKFKQAVCFGANRPLCAKSATECVGEPDDDSCKGDKPKAYQACTEPGNMTGPIKEGLEYRMSHTSMDCDTWEEVVYESGGLRQECDPWLGAPSKRVIMIPIVDGMWSGSKGSKVIDIVGFAIFFLETFDGSQCSGSDCDIVGRFIETTYTTSYGGISELTEDSAVTIVRLIN